MYTVKSQTLFAAAYAGALAGMQGQGLGSDTASTTPAQYATPTQLALAYAQQFDTVAGGLGNQPSIVVAQVQALSLEAFRDRNPLGGTAFSLSAMLTPTFWLPLVTAIVAILTESTTTIAAEIANPPGVAGLASLSGKNAADTATAQTTTYDVSADVAGGYIPKSTGQLLFIATMTTLCSIASQPTTLELRIAAAADATGGFAVTNAGTVVDEGCGTLMKVYPCVAGTPINPGIQGTTTGGNTVKATAGNVAWTIIELQGS
jgi:hypothetical protein